MISHSGAYSRLLRPSGARGECGKNRFHRPAALALGLSSSMMVVGIQALPLAVLGDFFEKACLVWVNVLVHEGQQACLHLLYFGGEIEIHVVSSNFQINNKLKTKRRLNAD
jgi:hypothetical protein